MTGYLLSNQAEADLEAILDYIAADNTRATLGVHDRFLDVYLAGSNPVDIVRILGVTQDVESMLR